MRPFAAALVCAFVAGCPGGPQDVSLPVPSPGFQLATAAWDVPQGTEQQRCYFFRVPGTGTTPYWISRIVAAQNPGTHHLNVFRVRTILALDGEHGDVVDGGECWKSGNWADWPLVMNSQESSEDDLVDWKLPSGVAQKLVPGEKLMLQTHYVNASTQKTPRRAKSVVNFHATTAGDPPLAELGTVFATNQNLKICPGDTNKTFTTTCRFARDQAVTILAANGHFHSRGVKFTMSPVDGLNETVGGVFYTSTEWADPPFSTGLSVPVPANGGVSWSCVFSMPANGCGDPANSCCATFGGHVETQEHCNAFVYYYPKVADATCF